MYVCSVDIGTTCRNRTPRQNPPPQNNLNLDGMLPFVTGICAVVEVMLFLSLLPLLLFAKRNHHYIYNYKSTFWLPFC